MELIVAGGVLACLWFLWRLFRWFKYTRDPSQHRLAALLAEEATKEILYGKEFDSSSTIALYVMGQPWSRKEASWRLLSAATLVAQYNPELDRQADSLSKRAIEKLS
jgi:hypothetical protein